MAKKLSSNKKRASSKKQSATTLKSFRKANLKSIVFIIGGFMLLGILYGGALLIRSRASNDVVICCNAISGSELAGHQAASKADGYDANVELMRFNPNFGASSLLDKGCYGKYGGYGGWNMWIRGYRMFGSEYYAKTEWVKPFTINDLTSRSLDTSFMSAPQTVKDKGGNSLYNAYQLAKSLQPFYGNGADMIMSINQNDYKGDGFGIANSTKLGEGCQLSKNNFGAEAFFRVTNTGTAEWNYDASDQTPIDPQTGAFRQVTPHFPALAMPTSGEDMTSVLGKASYDTIELGGTDTATAYDAASANSTFPFSGQVLTERPTFVFRDADIWADDAKATLYPIVTGNPASIGNCGGLITQGDKQYKNCYVRPGESIIVKYTFRDGGKYRPTSTPGITRPGIYNIPFQMVIHGKYWIGSQINVRFRAVDDLIDGQYANTDGVQILSKDGGGSSSSGAGTSSGSGAGTNPGPSTNTGTGASGTTNQVDLSAIPTSVAQGTNIAKVVQDALKKMPAGTKAVIKGDQFEMDVTQSSDVNRSFSQGEYTVLVYSSAGQYLGKRVIKIRQVVPVNPLGGTSTIADQEAAINAAKTYKPAPGVSCTQALTPATHDATGARYTFPNGCLAPGWTRI